jgi:hypothetical protein
MAIGATPISTGPISSASLLSHLRLDASALTVGAASVSSPALGIVLAAGPVTAGAPVLPGPVFTGFANLTAVALAASAGSVGAPPLGKVLAATGLTAGGSASGTPDIGQVLSGAALSVSTSPSCGAPAFLGTSHPDVSSLATGTPSLGAPAFLATSHLLPASMVLNIPTCGHFDAILTLLLEASALATGMPAVGGPDLGQVLRAADVATSGTIVPNVFFLGFSVLPNAMPLTAGAPVFSAPMAAPTGGMVAAPLIVSAPTVGAPGFATLVVTPLTAGSPTVGNPDIGALGIVIGDRVAAYGLNCLHTDTDAVYITKQAPTSYEDATSTHAVARALMTRGQVFGPPTSSRPGRVVRTLTMIEGEVIQDSDVETHWCAVDTTTSTLLAYGPLNASVSITVGESFRLQYVSVGLANLDDQSHASPSWYYLGF